MKKIRFQRMLAIAAASAVMFCQPGITSLAQETEPVTEAFANELETSAPVPAQPPAEAPAPAETQAETPAPAPAESSDAPVDIIPEAEPEGNAETDGEINGGANGEEPSAPASESENDTKQNLLELDDEDEPVSGLTAVIGDLEVTLTLPEGRTVEDDTVLKVTAVTAADGGAYNDALSLVRKKTDKGHRSLAKLDLYRVELVSGGETKPLDGGAKLTFAWSGLVSPGLTPWMQGEAFVFRVGDEAEELCEISLSADKEDHRGFTGFEISGKDLSLIGIAGVQNNSPKGSGLKKKELLKELENLTPCVAAANRLESEEGALPDGQILAGEIITGEAKETEESKEEPADDLAAAETVKKLLKEAAGTGLKLADSASSSEAVFVTVYADEKGRIDEEPLGGVLRTASDGTKLLDVTDHLLVINIVAADEKQELKLPEWDVLNRNESEAKHPEGTAGKVLFNLAAADGSALTEYKGTLTVKEDEKGTILAPAAQVVLEKEALGAVFADKLILKKGAGLQQAAFGADYEEPEETKAQPMLLKRGALSLTPDTRSVYITVNAFLGEEGNVPLPADLSLGVYDENGDLIEDIYGNSFGVKTIKGGSRTISFGIESLYEDVFKGADVYVRPVCDPAGYKLLSADPEDGKVTVFPEGAGAEPATLEFRLEEAPESFFCLVVEAMKESTGKVFPRTAVYMIEDEDGNKLANAEGEELRIELAPDEENKAFIPNGYDFPMFAAIVPGEHQTFYVVQESVTRPWKAKEEKIPFVVFRDEDGNFSVAGSEDEEADRHSGKEIKNGLPITFLYTKPEAYIALNINAVQTDTGQTMTPDKKLAYELQDSAYRRLQSITLDASNPRKITIDTAASSFFDDLIPGGEKELLLVRTDVPDGFRYLNTSFPLCASMDENGTVSIYLQAEPDKTHTGKDDPLEVVFGYEKAEVLSSDKVRVTKSLYLGEDTGIYHTGAYKYYVALFKDEALKERATDVRTISFTGAGLTSSTTFSSLTPGTYYVGETDASGNPVGREPDRDKASDPFYVDYTGQKVAVSSITSRTIAVEMKNHYFKLPADCAYYGRFKITKNVTDELGNPQNSGGTFYFKINDDTKNIKTITMDGTSSASAYVYLKASDDEKSYRVTEVKPRMNNGAYAKDSSGNIIYDEMTNTSGSTWNVSYQNRTVTVIKGQKEVPEVTVTNRAVNRSQPETDAEPGSGSETGSSAKSSDTATITMVKKATYKGNPIRLNSTFYFGIFEDEALTKPRSAPVKMTLSNASEKKRTMTVNLYMLEKDRRTVTLYFAETDSKGKVLTSADSGYDISPQGAVKVTVDPQNPEATVTFTNNITVGSDMESRLFDPASGLAGDANAIEDSYNGIGGTSEDAASGNSAKTGDDTPLALWMTTLLCACMAAWLMLGQRSGRASKKRR